MRQQVVEPHECTAYGEVASALKGRSSMDWKTALGPKQTYKSVSGLNGVTSITIPLRARNSPEN